jgi:predicted permease
MILRDISYAFRMMAKDPGFTAVVALSIALGIAANTTVFSLANATLFSSLPVPDPGGLYAIGGVHATTSYPDYRDFRDRCRDVFSGLSAHFPLAPANMSGTRTPERVWGQLVSGNYFSLVGPPLLMGRGIAPREDAAVGSEPVVVLSHGLWRRRFGGDPNILGKPLVLSGRPYTIIGVTASGFRGTDGGVIAEFFAPLSMRNDFMPELTKDAESRNTHWLVMTGRLKPGVNRKQAAAAINLVSKQLDEVHRKDRRNEPVPLVAAGGIPGASGFINGFMALLMATVVLVLLVACANAANLLLARAVERQHEMGVRMAIGAGRGRLIRQLLVESVALSMVGAVGGFALAFLAARALSGVELPLPIPVAFDFTPDLRVLGLTAALAVATGILFGLAPAFSATRKDLVSSLRLGKSRSGTSRRMGLGKLLVGVQVTLSVVLLTGAGLFLRSLQSAASLDLGIRPDNVLMLSVDPKTNNYSPERTRDFLRQLDRRVTALPGVQSLTAVNLVPLSFASNSNQYVDASAPAGKRTDADVFHVTSAYFDTMGIPLVRGRDFSPERDLETSTALVSLTMARRLFGSEDPIGRRVSGGGKTYEIVGLVGDSKTVTLGEEVKACIYAYLPRDPNEIISLLGMTVFVKTTGAPGRMIGPVRAQVEALDPNLAVFNAGTLSDHVTRAFFLPRVCAWLFGAFGAVGLTLATVGLFGLLSYSVRSRTREIGIRMALGAAPAAILILVLRQALVLVVISLIVGIGVSIALSRVTASLLYGVSATDPITFTVVPLVLLGAALAAVVVPARRAMGVEPLDALRSE